MEKIIVLSPDQDYCSFATETVIIKRHDEAGESYMSIECKNMQPDEEWGAAQVTLTSKDAKELCDKIMAFALEVENTGVK